MKKSILIVSLTFLSFSFVESLKADVIRHNLLGDDESDPCYLYKSGDPVENAACHRYRDKTIRDSPTDF